MAIGITLIEKLGTAEEERLISFGSATELAIWLDKRLNERKCSNVLYVGVEQQKCCKAIQLTGYREVLFAGARASGGLRKKGI
jgi:hypothetical protein